MEEEESPPKRKEEEIIIEDLEGEDKGFDEGEGNDGDDNDPDTPPTQRDQPSPTQEERERFLQQTMDMYEDVIDTKRKVHSKEIFDRFLQNLETEKRDAILRTHHKINQERDNIERQFTNDLNQEAQSCLANVTNVVYQQESMRLAMKSMIQLMGTLYQDNTTRVVKKNFAESFKDIIDHAYQDKFLMERADSTCSLQS